MRLAPVLRRVPHHLDRIADQIEQGRFTVRVSMFSDADDVRIFTYLANRAILAFDGATLGVVSAMLFQTATRAKSWQVTVLTWMLLCACRSR